MVENELTKSLKRRLVTRLEPRLRKLGFFGTCPEKSVRRLRFDLWAYNRSKRCFFILELEIRRRSPEENVSKVAKVLEYRWKPHILMFQIFSPIRSDRKERCLNEAERLSREYPRQFRYEQLELDIQPRRLRQMLRAFVMDKHRARRHYSQELRKEAERITARVIARTYQAKRVLHLI